MFVFVDSSIKIRQSTKAILQDFFNEIITCDFIHVLIFVFFFLLISKLHLLRR